MKKTKAQPAELLADPVSQAGEIVLKRQLNERIAEHLESIVAHRDAGTDDGMPRTVVEALAILEALGRVPGATDRERNCVVRRAVFPLFPAIIQRGYALAMIEDRMDDYNRGLNGIAEALSTSEDDSPPAA